MCLRFRLHRSYDFCLFGFDGQLAVERLEQGGFSGTYFAYDIDKFAFVYPEVYLFKQRPFGQCDACIT